MHGAGMLSYIYAHINIAANVFLRGPKELEF